jgi:hypothetical protein
MMRRTVQSLVLTAVCLTFAIGQAFSQSNIIFDQKSVCDSKTNLVDKKKFFAAALTAASKEPGIGLTKVLNQDFTVNRRELYFANKAHFDNFKKEFLDDPKVTYFEVTRGRHVLNSGQDLVDHPEAYDIRCVKLQSATLRSQIDEFTTKVSSNLAVGKDLDALSKPLAQRNPAKFSVTRDRVTNNTAFQTEFALAGYFNNSVEVRDAVWTGGAAQTVFVDFYPFVASQTVSNTGPKLKDFEKTSIGAMLVLDNLPFFGMGANHFAFRGAHQLDTAKTFEANFGEVVWTPDFGPFRALEFGKTQRVGGPDGWWYRYELSGRLRAGEIIENNGISTLPSNGGFVRSGLKTEVFAGAAGSDFFSKFTASLSYLYFENLHGGNGIDHFHKVAAGLQYDLTENYGFGITYTQGRDEDLLTKVSQIMAALTIKFGGKRLPSAP